MLKKEINMLKRDYITSEYILKWAFLWCLVLTSSFFNMEDKTDVSIGILVLSAVAKLSVIVFIVLELINNNKEPEIQAGKIAVFPLFALFLMGDLITSYYKANIYEILTINPILNAFVCAGVIYAIVYLISKIETSQLKTFVMNTTGVSLMIFITILHLGMDMKASKDNLEAKYVAYQKKQTMYISKELTFFGFDYKYKSFDPIINPKSLTVEKK